MVEALSDALTKLQLPLEVFGVVGVVGVLGVVGVGVVGVVGVIGAVGAVGAVGALSLVLVPPLHAASDAVIIVTLKNRSTVFIEMPFLIFTSEV